MVDRDAGYEGLMHLAGFAVAHGVWCVSDNETLVPMAMTEVGEKRELIRFAADHLADGVAAGRNHVQKNPDEADRAVLVYDGYVRQHPEEPRSDALIAEAYDYGVFDEPIWIYQPYRRAADDDGFGVYPLKIEFPGEAEVDRSAASQAFLTGIFQHEKGSRVWDDYFVDG